MGTASVLLRQACRRKYLSCDDDDDADASVSDKVEGQGRWTPAEPRARIESFGDGGGAQRRATAIGGTALQHRRIEESTKPLGCRCRRGNMMERGMV